MASCDTAADYVEAFGVQGWRTFRTAAFPSSELLPGEVWCPAAPEGGASRTCSECGLCRGGERGPSIAILPHGAAVSMSVWRARERAAAKNETEIHATP